MAEEVDEEEAFPDPADWRNWVAGGPFAEDGGAKGAGGEKSGTGKARRRGGAADRPSPSAVRRQACPPDRPESRRTPRREGRKRKAARSLPAASAGSAAAPGEGLRYRHDGFTPGKQRRVLEVLTQTGCVTDASVEVGISTTSAYRARRRMPGFAREWDRAQAMAGTPIDLLAFERATVGAVKKIWRKGKLVRVEQKPSDAILRTLLMITAKAREKQPQKPLKRRQQAVEDIMAKFDALQPPAGWTDGPMGAKVPPGYRLVPVKEEEEPEGGETGGASGGGETPLLPPPAEEEGES